jgi:hypothetical protein
MSMQPKILHIKKSQSVPEVTFQIGSLKISGDCFPEDSVKFFNPILNWIDQYMENNFVKDPKNRTVFESELNYVNTGSRPFVLTIVKQLNDLYKQGHQVDVKWYYYDDEELDENDDIQFNDLISDFVLPVQFIRRK